LLQNPQKKKKAEAKANPYDDDDDHHHHQRMSLPNGTVFHEKLTVIHPIMKFRALVTS